MIQHNKHPYCFTKPTKKKRDDVTKTGTFLINNEMKQLHFSLLFGKNMKFSLKKFWTGKKLKCLQDEIFAGEILDRKIITILLTIFFEIRMNSVVECFSFIDIC